MSERKSLSGGDWAAIGVFLVGSLVAVLMAYGLSTGAGGTTGTAAIGAWIAGAIGAWPALVAGAGVGLLGARAFLAGDRAGIVTGALGVLGVSIGLSVVAGSLSELRGGSLGASTGGRVAELAHPAVGVLLGAIVAFGAAYFAWMREDPTAAAKLAPARRATTAPPKGDDGVTAAESAMLIRPVADVDEDEPARPIAAPAKPVKPVYPEDVRLKGEIPSGTRPLTAPNALAAAPVVPTAPEPAVYRWTAPRAGAAAVDPTRIAPEEIEALADEAPPIPELVAVAIVAEEIVEEDEVAEDARPMPPRPTWETTGLAEDDEPVDAYGTPLSLVEKTRREAVEETAAVRIPREIGEIAEDELEAARERESEALELEPTPAEVAEVLEEELDEEAPVVTPLVVETEVEAGDDPVAVVEEERTTEAPAGERIAAALARLDDRPIFVEPDAALTAPAEEAVVRADVSELLAHQESLLEELRANNAAARAEAAAIDEEYDALEAEMATAEVEPIADAEADDEIDERVEETEVVAAIDEPTPTDEDAVEALEEPAPVVAIVDEEPVEEVVEPEPVVVAVPAPRAKVAAAAAAPGLFDAVEPEPQVVLKPQPAVPASRAEKAPARGIDPEKKLLVEVGCMFVERGRVAVSMLQRQYDMDFDQACRVLDDLQEMGLIGPYMGGKNRDILLTKEQWLEKVGAGVG